MHTGFRVRLVAVILFAALAAQWCSAQAVPPTDLKALNAKYEQGLIGIQTAIDKALGDWPPAYVAELKKVEQKLQGSGDLEGMLAVRNEMKRFDKEKKIPDGALSEVPVLKDLQLKWRKTPAAIELDKSQRISALARSYMAALEDLKKNLTKQGKIELAIEVKNEIERVKTSAPVAASEVSLTHAGVALRPDGDKGGGIRPSEILVRQPPAQASGGHPSSAEPYKPSGGFHATLRVADDFVPQHDTRVGIVTWWGCSYDGQHGKTDNLVQVRDFLLEIFESSGESNTIGRSIYREVVPIAKSSPAPSDYKMGGLGLPLSKHRVSLRRPPNVKAGKCYWLSISAFLKHPAPMWIWSGSGKYGEGNAVIDYGVTGQWDNEPKDAPHLWRKDMAFELRTPGPIKDDASPDRL